jgi:hypothetical protein
LDGHSWSEACGLTITALIVLSPENPLLARELNIGLMHHQALFALGHSLQVMEQQRRTKEAEQGKDAAANVKL